MSLENEYNNYIENLVTRSIPVSSENINIEKRAIKATAATENPVVVLDRKQWKLIREIILVRGVVIPDSKQVPLLDNHDAFDGINSLRGSFRDITKNETLEGWIYFSSSPEGEKAWQDVKDRHLTDVSIGYLPPSEEFTHVIKYGDKKEIGGKIYNNDYEDKLDLVVREKSILKELSLTIFGADEKSKIKRESFFKNYIKGGIMPEKELGTNEGQEPVEKHETELQRKAQQDNAEIQRKAHLKETEEARKAAIEEGKKEYKRTYTEIQSAIQLAVGDDAFKRSLENELLLGDNFYSVEDARKVILERQGEYLKTNDHKIIVTVDNTDKFTRAASDAMLLAMGGHINDDKRRNEIENSREELPHSIHSLIRMAYARNNPNNVKAFTMNSDELYDFFFERAFSVTQGDIPSIMLDAMNKLIGTSFDRVETTWDKWCAIGSARDFRTIYSISRSQATDWKKILDGADFNYATFRDKRESAQIETYGRAIVIPRSVFINDDLDMLNDILQLLSIGAANQTEDLVYQTLIGTSLAGPTMTETSRALFNATDGNLKSSSGVVSETSLAAARKSLRALASYGPNDKGESRTRYTGLKASYLVTGTANEESIVRYFASPYLTMNTVADNMTPVSTAKRNITPIFSEAYQYYADAQSLSNAWHIVADKNSGFVLCKVFFLNGERRPTLRRADSQVGKALGVTYDGYYDVGVGFPEWRAGYANDGA